MRDFVQIGLSGKLPSCTTCHIRAVGVCSDSARDELAQLEKTKRYKCYPAGSNIALTGEALSHVGTMMLGIASLSRILADGRRQTVGLLHPGDFLGSPGRPVMQFDVEAVTDVELCGFDNRSFDQLLAQSPQLHARLIEVMLDELDAVRDWMVLLGRKTAREKLCSFLLYLAYRQNRHERDLILVHVPMSQDKIADFLALTIETVSRQFSSLAADGLIEKVAQQRFRLPDLHAIAENAGEDSDGGLWA